MSNSRPERLGWYRALEGARVYSFAQKLVGSQKASDAFWKSRISPHLLRDPRILDVGCGPGTFLEKADPRHQLRYTGVDPNRRYIGKARNRFPQALFEEGTALSPKLQKLGDFDLIVLFGVLHHLSDEVATTTLSFCFERLAQGGTLISLDPVVFPKQNKIAGILAERDRGRHVRTPEGYERLYERSSGNVSPEVEVVSGLLRVPYNHLMVTVSQ